MTDESHQHAVLTPDQLREIVDEALAVRTAIDEDDENPFAAPFLDRLAGPFSTDHGIDEMVEVQQEAIEALIDRLDVYALALLQVTADGTRLG